MPTAPARPLLHLPALLPALWLGLALSLPGVAEARRSGSSHASSHSSGSHATADSHTSSKPEVKQDGDGPGFSLSLPRTRSGEREGTQGSAPATLAAEPGMGAVSGGKPMDAGQKAAVEAEAARRLEESLAQARQKAAAEQAALAAEEDRKRREAEQREQDQQQAKLDQAQRQYAWESRCQIMPVMSDEEIATCREVWTRPAPKHWTSGK